MKEKKKSVLITGASSGIGLTTANHLAQSGYQVFAGFRSASDGAKFESGIIPLRLDVTDEESIAAALNTVMESTSGSLNALICNAGIPLAGPLELVNLDRFADVLEVNVLGNVRVTQHFVPLLRSCAGKIVFIGSISGRISLPFQGAYSASKFALESIADALRLELRPWNITVTIIEPGNVTTKIRNKALAAIEANLQELTPQEKKLYKPIYDFALQHASKKSAEPMTAARLIERVLGSDKIKPRYLLGNDAGILSLIARLPTRWRDRIISSKLPKYGG